MSVVSFLCNSSSMGEIFMEQPSKQTITRLPTELIAAICSATTTTTTADSRSFPSLPSSNAATATSTLLALSLASSLFLPSAQRALFESISVVLATSSTSSSSGFYDAQRLKGAKVLEVLGVEERLAGYVRRFECRVELEDSKVEGEKTVEDMIRMALSNMHGLTELNLALLPTPSIFSSTTESHLNEQPIVSSSSLILQDVHLPLLQHLSVSSPLSSNILTLLSRSPLLSSLSLSPSPFLLPTPSTLDMDESPLPQRLTSFSGSIHDALFLLPGRMAHLRELFIRSGPASSAPTSTEEGEELALRRLFANARTRNASDGSNIASANSFNNSDISPLDFALDSPKFALDALELQTSLPPLEVLELLAGFEGVRGVRAMRIASGMHGGVRAPGMDFYHAVASLLDAFPALETFELCGTHWPCPTLTSISDSAPHFTSTPSSVVSSNPPSWHTRLPTMSTSSTVTLSSSTTVVSLPAEPPTIFSPPSPNPNSTPALAPAQLAPSLAEEWEDMFGVHSSDDEDDVLGHDDGMPGELEGFGDALFFEFA